MFSLPALNIQPKVRVKPEIIDLCSSDDEPEGPPRGHTNEDNVYDLEEADGPLPGQTDEDYDPPDIETRPGSSEEQIGKKEIELKVMDHWSESLRNSKRHKTFWHATFAKWTSLEWTLLGKVAPTIGNLVDACREFGITFNSNAKIVSADLACITTPRQWYAIEWDDIRHRPLHAEDVKRMS
jgi:hypothetical protein